MSLSYRSPHSKKYCIHLCSRISRRAVCLFALAGLIAFINPSYAGPAAYNSSSNAYLACKACWEQTDDGNQCNISYASVHGWENLGYDVSGDAMKAIGISGAYMCNPEATVTKFYYIANGYPCTNQDSSGRCNPPPPNECKTSTPKPFSGNPIDTLSGIKSEINIDYQHPLNPALSMVRTYSSATGSKLIYGQLGYGRWTHSLERRMVNNYGFYDAFRPDGRIIEIEWLNEDGLDKSYRNSSSTAFLKVQPDNSLELTIRENGVSINETYLYSSGQYLISKVEDITANKTLDFSYDGTLVTVTDELSNTVRYRIDNQGRIVEFFGGGNLHFAYTYIGENLTQVTYPDDSTILYHYENNEFPTALTGITNQKGDRYVTWHYDNKGRAISSEHAGGVDKVTLDFTHSEDSEDRRVVETNPLGKQTTYHFKWQDGARLLTRVEGHASSGCVASNASYTYDENGHVDTVTDQEGNITDYNYSANGNELQRIEAKGTPQERVISTIWSLVQVNGNSVEVRTKITEANKVTEFIYDDNGQLLNKIIKPVVAQ